MTKTWTTWRPRPTKTQEVQILERALRELRVSHYATSVYARKKQGAPDFLLSGLGLAIWLYAGRDVSPKQAVEQAMMRQRGWRVLMPETANEALTLIDECTKGNA